MSPTASALAVLVASSGVHPKMIAFWAAVVLAVLVVVLLVRHARAKRRRPQQGDDNWHPHAHTDPGENR